MAQGDFYIVVMSDRNIAALYRVGEGAPVDIAELGAGGLAVADSLAVIDAREFAVIEYTVDGAEAFTHSGQCFHAAHQHGAVADYPYNLFFWVDQFGGINCGHAIAHGVEARG